MYKAATADRGKGGMTTSRYHYLSGARRRVEVDNVLRLVFIPLSIGSRVD